MYEERNVSTSRPCAPSCGSMLPPPRPLVPPSKRWSTRPPGGMQLGPTRRRWTRGRRAPSRFVEAALDVGHCVLAQQRIVRIASVPANAAPFLSVPVRAADVAPHVMPVAEGTNT